MQNSEGEYLVDLPPVSHLYISVCGHSLTILQVEMTVVRVTLDDETRVLYDEIERLSQERFMRHVDGNKVKVRLRLLACLGHGINLSLRSDTF